MFFGLSYQNRSRYTNETDGGGVIGVGLGDAVNSVGAELSYSLNSFGLNSGFGSGAFNAKLHKRIGEDTAVAIGWNQFATVYLGQGRNSTSPNGQDPSDYPKNSYYAVGSKIFRTREDINDPFSRVAVTGGIGGGVFLPFDGTTTRTNVVSVRPYRTESATNQSLAAHSPATTRRGP